MLKKEVKRIEWGLPQEQADQRTEAKYLLGITDEVVEEIDGGGGKSVKPEGPKDEPKEEEKGEEKEEELEKDEEEDEEEVETKSSTRKK